MAGTEASIRIIGNLSGNIENTFIGEKQTPKLSFSLAHTRRAKKDGAWQDVTDWWDVYCVGRLAEQVGGMLEKGIKVSVRGEPQKREYTKNGETRRTVDIEADKITILSPKKDREGQAQAAPAPAPQPAPQKPQPRPQAKAPTPPPDFGASEEDIPFSRPAALDGICFAYDGSPR
jgi:single-strand DNA-binding protein